MTPNPYEADDCFLEKNGCPMPSDAELETLLPSILDIDQVLTVGAVNAPGRSALPPVGVPRLVPGLSG